MFKMRKLLAATLALLLLFVAAPVMAAGEKPLAMIDIFAVNDFHGRLLAEGEQPGAAAVAGALRKLQEANPQGALVLAAGDMVNGTMEADWLDGQPVVAMLQRANTAAMTLGNHEFNWSAEKLAKLGQVVPFIAANVVEKESGQRPAFVQPYLVVERSDLRIGIIGLATPESAFKAHPREVGHYRFLDPVESARQTAGELQGKVDMIILLTHLGSDVDNNGRLPGEVLPLVRAAKSMGVAAVVTGHSHKRVAVEQDGVQVVQGGYYGRAIGKISLLYSRLEKKVISGSSAVIDVIEAGYPPDDKTAEAIASVNRQVAAMRSEVLTTSGPALSHDRWQLSPLGCYAADVLRAAFKADAAFIGGGSIRDNLNGGRITAGDLYRVLPFSDQVETGRLSGQMIREIMEYGLFNTKVGVLQFSGLKVETDASRPQGSKIVRITLADGRELQDDAWYKVAANSFIAAGGDQYEWFGNMKERQEWRAQLRDVMAVGLRSGGLASGGAQERWLQH